MIKRMSVFLFSFLLLSQHEVVRPNDVLGYVTATLCGTAAGLLFIRSVEWYEQRCEQKKQIEEFRKRNRYSSGCMTPTYTHDKNIKKTCEFFYKNIYNQESLENVNHNTEEILAKVSTGALSRGDVVIIVDQENLFNKGSLYVGKRLIGLPGDTIEGKRLGNKAVIYLNGELLEEPYIDKVDNAVVFNEETKKYEWRVYHPDLLKDEPYLKIERICFRGKICKGCNDTYKEIFFKVTLGPDEAWVMGDNRVNSNDSRYIGPIKIKHIIGKIRINRVHEEYYTPYYENLEKEQKKQEENKTISSEEPIKEKGQSKNKILPLLWNYLKKLTVQSPVS